MITNEKEFDARLNRIGDLYEQGKDYLHELPIGSFHGAEMTAYNSLFDILRELRDIAATGLKANHEIKDN